MIYNRLNIR